MRQSIFLLLLVMTIILVPSGRVLADEHRASPTKETEEINTGQDKTRPLTRLDVRYRYYHLPSGGDQNTLILRADKPFVLKKDWSLATRIDIPLICSDMPSRDNPDGSWRSGTGDVLVQAYLIKSFDKRSAVAFGGQVIFPTAREDQMGTGKFQAVPLVAYRISLPEISRGSFFLPIIRYAIDYAGHENRHHIRQLQLEPVFNVNLPKLWFITFYPSPDIRYNFKDHKWFVPFDAMLGKLLSRKIVCSLEVSIPIVRDYPLYDFTTETRIGFLF